MADGGHNIFVYLGGEQEVPDDVTHVIIDRSVKIIPDLAFRHRTQLVSLKMHDRIEKIGKWAFTGCISLREIKLPGVVKVEYSAFKNCSSLTDVGFGDKLETIGEYAFNKCDSLRSIKMPSVRTIEDDAFAGCEQLTDVEMPAVERIGICAFYDCHRLQRIAIPLKDNMFPLVTRHEQYAQFDYCFDLRTADLVGGIHKTISSLLLDSWRDDMNQEINRINQVLPRSLSVFSKKTDAIRLWIKSVISRMEQYKAEHNTLLKEDMTLLELAVWKAKLDGFLAHSLEAQPTKKAKTDVDVTRKEQRITSGASIIIKNVLPFLRLE